MEPLSLLYCTVFGKEEALELSDKIIGSNLAACVNILENIMSVYRWDDKLIHNTESVLIIKTRASLADDLKSFIINNHSYDTPCIVEVPLGKVSEKFHNWVLCETRP